MPTACHRQAGRSDNVLEPDSSEAGSLTRQRRPGIKDSPTFQQHTLPDTHRGQRSLLRGAGPACPRPFVTGFSLVLPPTCGASTPTRSAPMVSPASSRRSELPGWPGPADSGLRQRRRRQPLLLPQPVPVAGTAVYRAEATPGPGNRGVMALSVVGSSTPAGESGWRFTHSDPAVGDAPDRGAHRHTVPPHGARPSWWCRLASPSCWAPGPSHLGAGTVEQQRVPARVPVLNPWRRTP